MEIIEVDIGNQTTDEESFTFLSDRERTVFELVFFTLGCGLVCMVGMVTNTINIIVFVKQGAYREHGSVNLLGLSIMDLLVVTNTLYNSVLYGITLMDLPNLSWVPFDVTYITAAWPHLMFVQMSRAVTAYIAFERCVCVVFPFKVKSMFTPTRSIVVILCIFISFLLSYSPVFIKQQLKYMTDPVTNVTKLRVVSSSDWVFVVDMMWAINSVLINQGSVLVVLVCTVITVSRVKLSKSWRDATSSSSTSGSSKQDNSQSKEKRLIKMITLISFIFLACYTPDLIFMLMYAINSEIRLGYKYNNLALAVYSLVFFFESINSTINIVVYYRMSSKYKQTFRQLMGMGEEKKV